MAGDFLMVQFATPRKIEVARVAGILGIAKPHAFGLCVMAWMWFDEQTEDGRALGATEALLDSEVGHAGLADALRQVGWLHAREGALELPNFDRIMGQSAKKRAKNNERQRNHRGNEIVTKKCDKSVTKEKKRREEKKLGDKSPKPLLFIPPTEDEVAEFCTNRGNAVDPVAFVNFYKSKGWKVGAQAMKDWRAAVITWEKNTKRVTDTQSNLVEGL